MSSDPLVIVSADCHIGPRLVEDLRPYCPAALLDEYDAYVGASDRSRGRYVEEDDVGSGAAWQATNQGTAGHHDPAARRRDLDFDGVAAEVIFHGSQNNEPIPFQTSMLGPPEDPDLAAAGLRIYNRWLADMCAAEPHRHVGLVHLPLWDPEASIEELRWARDAGLRGVNFPAPRPWLRPYNERVWEPFWAVAADLDMPLVTHAGAGDPSVFGGPELVALMSTESGGWFSRRAVHLLIFAGVFERHPGLKLVMTEQPGEWWPYTRLELDSVHMTTTRGNAALRRQVPRRPSEYMHRNVYIGASFLSHAEAEGAIRDGYADRIMWGSDYPHLESTFQYPGDDFTGGTSTGKQALRFTFAGIPEDHVRAMVGLTAAHVFGLDVPSLERIAAAIDAPTYEDVSVPLEAVPAGASPLAFRTFGPWS
ncbi:MAG TPA: amidohydrolase family protein [Acidimicrobiia bacterium]|nr:amidohydrolase family protein [Acidimicrobiia bacterium]